MPKKPRPAQDAAHHLANLLGREVSGCAPDACAGDAYAGQIVAELLAGQRTVPGLDCEVGQSHPYTRQRDAAFIALAYLLRAQPAERAALLARLHDEDVSNAIARFFLRQVRAGADRDGIQAAIEGCGPQVFGQELNPTLRLSVYNWWFATLSAAPTRAQFERAAAVLSGDEKKEGDTA